MAAQSSILPPSFEGGGDQSPFPSSPSTTTTDSASGSPDNDIDCHNESRIKKMLNFHSLTSTPSGKAPPNSTLTTPDVKTPSGASSAEVGLLLGHQSVCQSKLIPSGASSTEVGLHFDRQSVNQS